MHILLVEDDAYKREKISSYLREINTNFIVDLALSYNSAVNLIKSNAYDFAIVDMTLPSYDKSGTQLGGRMRSFGGKQIIRQMIRSGKHIPFVVLTQFTSFSEGEEAESLDAISNSLNELCNNIYLGTIYFDSTNSKWKASLKKVIERLRNGEYTIC